MRHDLLIPIVISTLAACRSVPVASPALIPEGHERRAVVVRDVRATDLATTLNEIMRSARKATRERAFEIGACVLFHPRSLPNAQLEDFDGFQGDDRAQLVWVTAKPEDQARLAEPVQRLDRERER